MKIKYYQKTLKLICVHYICKIQNQIQIFFEMSKEQKEKTKAQDKKKEQKEEDLSIEDKELKEKIDHYCQQLLSNQQGSLKELIEIVKSSTKTMTSVPKPFKFLKTHYPALVENFKALPDSQYKKLYADFLSALSMIFGEKGERRSLFYLLQGTNSDFTTWGHGYVSNLANDISKQYDLRLNNLETTTDLVQMTNKIIPYFILNNAEHDAIDLLLNVDKLQDIKQYVNHSNFSKVHMYLAAMCGYCTDQDELQKILTILYQISLTLSEYTVALRFAIKLDDHEKIKHVFDECPDQVIKKQLAFNAARQKIFIQGLSEEQNQIMSNSKLAGFYLELAKDLQVQEPKQPRDVFKVHLEDNYKGGGQDPKAVTLYNIYVNAFVNAGLTRDTLMIPDEEDEEKKGWIILLKQKEDWQIAAVASLGLLCPWNSQTIQSKLMPYIDNEGKYIKAGASLGVGLCCAGINDQNDMAFGLLSESAQQSKQSIIKQCSILGLGMAYAGRNRTQLQQIFTAPIVDTDCPLEESAFAALSLGLTFVGQCNEEVANAIVQTLMERSEDQLNSHTARYFGIGLALLFMGQQNKCEATLQAINLIEHPIKKFIQVMVTAVAYVGSGNVLKVQDMIHQCMTEDKNSQAAILGLALIASSEQIGNQMAMRLINHILHFGKVEKKRIIPLALAMLNLSNPKIGVMDILIKLAYDTDTETAERAILALGLIGAGSNNSRLADIFRKLASYYSKQSEPLFCIRMSQGLLYMGKGMLSIQPYYSERFLLSKVGMAGVIIFLTSLLDIKSTLLSKQHYFIYFLALAMYPKFLFVVNEKLQPMPLNLRVGQAVDVVGQAGKPKKITGFQTHSSPVLIGNGQRAELATEQFIPIQDCVLQNIVILKRNPEYVEQERPRKKTSM